MNELRKLLSSMSLHEMANIGPKITAVSGTHFWINSTPSQHSVFRFKFRAKGYTAYWIINVETVKAKELTIHPKTGKNHYKKDYRLLGFTAHNVPNEIRRRYGNAPTDFIRDNWDLLVKYWNGYLDDKELEAQHFTPMAD